MKGNGVNEKQFSMVVAKTSKEQQVQCRLCGAKSPVTNEAEIEEWCENHKCGQEKVSMTVANEEAIKKEIESEPDPEPTVDVDPEPTGDEESGDGEEEEDED